MQVQVLKVRDLAGDALVGSRFAGDGSPPLVSALPPSALFASPPREVSPLFPKIPPKRRENPHEPAGVGAGESPHVCNSPASAADVSEFSRPIFPSSTFSSIARAPPERGFPVGPPGNSPGPPRGPPGVAIESASGSGLEMFFRIEVSEAALSSRT